MQGSETSLVLVAREEPVRQEIAAELEPNPASLSGQFGKEQPILWKREARTYFGYPADASVNEGEETYGL